MQKYQNFPLIECEEGAKAVRARGGFIHQKFTCEACQRRITMNNPDTFYTEGHCEDCGHVTDLLKAGCNYVAFFPMQGGKLPVTNQPKDTVN